MNGLHHWTGIAVMLERERVRVEHCSRPPGWLSSDVSRSVWGVEVTVMMPVLISKLSELCVGGRGTARYPRRAAGHFAEGLFCPPAGGAPALLDGRNPLEYLSTGSSYAPRVHRVDIGSSDDVSTSCDSSSPTDTSHLHFWGHRSSVWQSIRADNLRWHDLRPPSCTDSDRRILES